MLILPLLLFAPVAQLDRVLACGAKGHRFKSCRVHHPLSFRFCGTTEDFTFVMFGSVTLKVRGENSRWLFARKPSDENLFSIEKFRGRRR